MENLEYLGANAEELYANRHKFSEDDQIMLFHKEGGRIIIGKPYSVGRSSLMLLDARMVIPSVHFGNELALFDFGEKQIGETYLIKIKEPKELVGAGLELSDKLKKV